MTYSGEMVMCDECRAWHHKEDGVCESRESLLAQVSTLTARLEELTHALELSNGSEAARATERMLTTMRATVEAETLERAAAFAGEYIFNRINGITWGQADALENAIRSLASKKGTDNG